MIQNKWLIPLIQSLEDKKYYGKVVLNFNGGDVPKVKLEEEIAKPKPKQK